MMKNKIFITTLILLFTGIILFSAVILNSKNYRANDIQEVPANPNVEILTKMGRMTSVKSFNLHKDFTSHAAKKLYNYLVKNYKDDIAEAKKYFSSLNEFNEKWVLAVEYDLNDDGVNEIIGIVPDCPIWGGSNSTKLFIIQKQNNIYKEIADLTYNYPQYYEPQDNLLVIMKEKTNNFHNMQYRKEINTPTTIHLIKFNNGEYKFQYYN